jgi:hypothetical protein
MSKLLKKDQILNFIKSILIYGINLELTTKAQELKTLIDMHRFINKKSGLRSYIEETRITIETSYYEPLAIVEIEAGVMSIIPVNDVGVFDSISVILDFIYHQQVKKIKLIKKQPIPDFEWI